MPGTAALVFLTCAALVEPIFLERTSWTWTDFNRISYICTPCFNIDFMEFHCINTCDILWSQIYNLQSRQQSLCSHLEGLFRSGWPHHSMSTWCRNARKTSMLTHNWTTIKVCLKEGIAKCHSKNSSIKNISSSGVDSAQCCTFWILLQGW